MSIRLQILAEMIEGDRRRPLLTLLIDIDLIGISYTRPRHLDMKLTTPRRSRVLSRDRLRCTSVVEHSAVSTRQC